ncbi:MAG TPA: methyltransferase domain-containing protein [Chitinophaga sp.]|uniref:methyltransferase domain-containing protein n=1 Tax=Chitinophaga sp. TaxID=1869181 RepID=UPI002C1D222B|nr:methyltransferase domain-containing protein [Chitinophaga sp.]HVI44018.1 methyltransferase domain-containing protein [Chitinophaga sp.]
MGQDIKERILVPEIMDDFEMEGSLLENALRKIVRINRLLGGNRITIRGVSALMRQAPDREVVITDIGCGNGDMLRVLADYGRRKGWKLRLVGIDANRFTVQLATALSAGYPEISYHCMDVTSEAFDDMHTDIALFTLTLHHFTDDMIIRLMQRTQRLVRIGVVVNDLQRNMLAYRLFQLICFLFRVNRMTKADGLASILRGFKRKELLLLAQQLNIQHYSLRWQWAFRYQWIISNL